MTDDRKFYVTTPIYYVNDRPHIGHVYTTTIADVLARYHRLRGDRVFFLTGTDEHAAKVTEAATARGLSPQQWADQNARVFQDTFAKLGITNDDFIRTTQKRHKDKVVHYIRGLLSSGDVYLGEYEGWYDAGQEEYVPENKAKEYDYKSPINGKPLVRKAEKNDFFRLSKYQDRLRELLESGDFVRPAARRNEVLARINEGLNDVPISRTGARGWGIEVPEQDDQTVYVWIDALFNYLSTVDTDERRWCWPAEVHLIAKDILWFHAVIWPAMLMALGLPLPKLVYAHSFWISEGQKMSKSLGNFIDLEAIDGYVQRFGLDALRWFLATRGPMGTTDSDFSEARFIESYNAELANTLGNCASRIANMVGRYFDGTLPGCAAAAEGADALREAAAHAVSRAAAGYESLDLEAAGGAGIDLVRAIDGFIESTQPFKLAKQEGKLGEVGTILHTAGEALRIASVLLWPIIPGKIETLWSRIGCSRYSNEIASRSAGWFEKSTAWGGLADGTVVVKGEALFPRYEPEQVRG